MPTYFEIEVTCSFSMINPSFRPALRAVSTARPLSQFAVVAVGSASQSSFILEAKSPTLSVQKTSGMEAVWAVNQSKLQNVMNQNLPIRNASSLSDMNGFYLNRERGLVKSSGWNYYNGYWTPPIP